MENEPVYSANGRYCAIARWYDVPDFGSERAGKVFHLDPEYAGEDDKPRRFSERVIVAWYEVTAAGRRRIAELPVSRDMDDVLVADSGQSLIAVRRIHGGPCAGSPKLTDPVVAVYRPDGTSGSLTAGDILTERDVERAPFVSDRFALRHESEKDERLILSYRRSDVPDAGTNERRVDLETVKMLDEKRPIYPAALVYATATDGMGEFFSGIADAPLPEFPSIADKARIRGLVILEVVVDDRGGVESVRVVKPLPFGCSEAAVTAVRQWRFRPFRAGGQLVKATGTIRFHFADLDETSWKGKLVPPFRLPSAAIDFAP